MTARHPLTDAQWRAVEPHLPVRKGRPGGDQRLFLDVIFKALQVPDLEEVMVDSTSCKVHQSVSGAQKKMVLKRLASLAAA